MSKENYIKAIQLIQEQEELAEFVGERSEELILKAERELGFPLPPMYRDFVLKFGAGNYGAEEVYGIIDDDFENSSVPDAIWLTMTERMESDLPQNLIIIYDTGIGDWYCLDINRCNRDGEAMVIAYSTDNKQNEVVYEDFGDFLFSVFSEA